MIKKILKFIGRKIGNLLGLGDLKNELKIMQNEIYFAQMFQMAIDGVTWIKDKAFSPGGIESAAMDACALHNLFRILNDVKPKSILEFGLGQSSKLVHQFANYFDTKALTVEHDTNWINYFKEHIGENYPINIQHSDLETVKINNKETLSYADIANITGKYDALYDFIIVDGPFGNEQKYYSRTQILEFIPRNLAKDFCILIHDSERIGEQGTINLLCDKLNKNNIKFLMRDYRSVKWHTIICSESWKFLASI